MNGFWARPLAQLELRRALPALALPCLLMLGLVLLVRPAPMLDLDTTRATGLAQGNVASGLLRQELWAAALWLLVPLAVYRAARIPGGWRAGAADWIGSRPVTRTAALTGSFLGHGFAVAGVVAAVAVAVELRAATSGVEGDAEARLPLFAGRLPLERTEGIEPGARHVLTLEGDALARNARSASSAHASLRARVRVTVLPGAEPTGRARLRAPDSPEAATPTRTIEARTWIDAELPAPSLAGTTGEPVELVLQNAGGAPLALLAEPGVELWRPEGGSGRDASIVVALHALLFVAWGSTIALACGAWMGSASAAATGLALLVLGLSVEPATSPWLTFGSGLVDALDMAGQGRVGRPPGWPAFVAWCTLLLPAHAAALRGLRSWRYLP